MKFLRLRLVNYIGIYNGMGLRDITIDFTKCLNRIVVIRGDNGSGKSTLMKSLSVFPDSNSQFIPDTPAAKEVDLFYDGVIYQIKFIHGISNNGSREVTKAYICKNGEDINPNGNVKSYRDIIYEELNLDPNFESLSQLSLDDRGLADKRPAERKKFVNSILVQMQAYNGIYKTISKKVSTCKSLIGNISAKLNTLGDKESQLKTLEDIESQINQIQDAKDHCVIELSRKNFELQSIDPNGTIRKQYDDLMLEKRSADSNCTKAFQMFNSICSSIGIDYNTVSKDSILRIDSEISSQLSSAESDARVCRIQMENAMALRESKSQDIERKTSRLSGITSGIDYDNVCSMILQIENEMELLQKAVAFDFDSINEDECELMLKLIEFVSEQSISIRSLYEQKTIEEAFERLRSNNFIPYTKNDGSYYENTMTDADLILRDLENQYNQMISDADLLSVLNDRPKTCKDDNCPFIKKYLLVYEKYHGNIDIESKKNEIEIQSKRLAELETEYKEEKKLHEAQISILEIIKYLSMNRVTFEKFFGHNINLNSFIYHLVMNNKDIWNAISKMKEDLNQSSLVSQYKIFQKTLENLLSDKKSYEDKMDIIADLNAEIDELNKDLNCMIEDISSKSKEIRILEAKANGYRNRLSDLNALSLKYDEYRKAFDHKTEVDNSIEKFSSDIESINSIKEEINRLAEEIKNHSRSLDPLMKRRDNINHSLRMSEEYEAELESLNKDYELLELIRKYSSPTTGIQLVFMELYMGKIISLANTLLEFLFNGRFTIMPFIINENEFRIPCQGDGYLNDDITSMSSGQICMISMILSFAILHNSSTTYNIIKLDEIDGPLDDINRAMFVDVLMKIMNIMKTEQCIMISHNSELDVNNADVILLKSSDGNISDGNIIWSAY